MKYYISYIKKGRKYSFEVNFKNKAYRDVKVSQYKKDAVNFKIREVL